MSKRFVPRLPIALFAASIVGTPAAIALASPGGSAPDRPTGAPDAPAGTSPALTADAPGPAVSVTSGPTGPTADPRPTFGFSSPDSSATFSCSIDTGTPDFGTCSGEDSDQPGTDLTDGPYTFRVKATDPAGNSTTATRSFSVDTQAPVDATPPTVAIAGQLADADGQPLRADTAAARIQATDEASGGSGVARIEVAVDGTVAATDTVDCSPTCPTEANTTYAFKGGDWGSGRHALTVTAVDAAGNARDVVLEIDVPAPSAAAGSGAVAKAPAASKRRGAPEPVPAWYMNATNLHDLIIAARDDACAVARGQPNHTRLMLLDFGQARRGKDGSFGARLTLVGKFFDNQEILQALKAAANRYRSKKCHSVGSAVIAYGNTNHMPDDMGNSEAHRAGRLQAAKAHDLLRYERQQQAAHPPSGGGYQYLGVAVAGDIEPGWDFPRITRALVDGANGGSGGHYFNFGNVGPCHHRLLKDWTLGDLGIVSRSESARPLPEIYSACHAQQWVRVRNHWLSNHRRGYRFHGVTTEPRSAGATLGPSEGWRKLHAGSGGHVGRELVNIRYSR
jgi:Bacterial Ig-like domain